MSRQKDRITFLHEIILESASGKREARISDLSPGGCYIDSIAQVHPEESVEFHLDNSAGESVVFKGRVAYVFEGQGFGVEFTDVNEEKQKFLNNLIKAHGG